MRGRMRGRHVIFLAQRLDAVVERSVLFHQALTELQQLICCIHFGCLEGDGQENRGYHNHPGPGRVEAWRLALLL